MFAGDADFKVIVTPKAMHTAFDLSVSKKKAGGSVSKKTHVYFPPKVCTHTVTKICVEGSGLNLVMFPHPHHPHTTLCRECAMIQLSV